jgi:hypothetical protein
MLFGLLCVAAMTLLPTTVQVPSGYTKLRSSRNSALYSIELPSGGLNYEYAPYLLTLSGSHMQIGYDYAALLSNETSATFQAFMDSVFPQLEDQLLLTAFIDLCWSSFLLKATPKEFLDELEGMRKFSSSLGSSELIPPEVVSTRFYTLANLPADPPNIIAMLENEYEGELPAWLKKDLNKLIALLERIVMGCDAYGVWGSRTVNGLLYTSRNLDYNTDTGITQYKLITVFDVQGSASVYATIGFAFGPGALAGISSAGITVSEMNLDNSQVTFNGLAFPLRLRYVLEHAADLESAMGLWNSTSNTNSFNFLIGSASDASSGNGAYALETILDYTAVFPANSPVERDSVYLCPPGNCTSWTNQVGVVHIGKPLPEAVWRSNHGMNPRVMATQEPLFNDTVFRYDLMFEIFEYLQDSNRLIDDSIAVQIVASLGTKGPNFLTCEQSFDHGENVMSIAYAPGPRADAAGGMIYAAWENFSGAHWRPAACSPYVQIDLTPWFANKQE